MCSTNIINSPIGILSQRLVQEAQIASAVSHSSFTMVPKHLHFITGNKNKLAEVQAILGDTISLSSTPLDIVEIQGTIEEITIDKCRRAAEEVRLANRLLQLSSMRLTHPPAKRSSAGRRHQPLLPRAEWTAWTVHASQMSEIMHQSNTADTSRKWFLTALGHEGLNKILSAYDDKTAEAVCTFAYSAGPGHEPIIFQGRTEVCLCAISFSSVSLRRS